LKNSSYLVLAIVAEFKQYQKCLLMNSCKIAIKIRLLSILHSISDLFKALIRAAGINEYARAAYDSKEASHANNASCTALFTTPWLTSFHGL